MNYVDFETHTHNIFVKYLKQFGIEHLFEFSDKENGSKRITYIGDNTKPATYNITIKELIGVKNYSGEKVSYEEIGKKLADIISEIVKDCK